MYSSAAKSAGSRYLPGDEDPDDFTWTDVLTPTHLLNLLQRNGKIRKACAWVSREAIRPRFNLKKEKKIPGTKFGKSYLFETTIEYLEWIGFFTQLECVYTWSRLFGVAIMVFFKEGEGKLAKYEARTDYDSIQTYYPLAGENGYEIQLIDNKIYYKVTFTNIIGNQESFLVCSDRVVEFHAPHLEIKYNGSSEVEPMAKLAIVQEQMFKSLIKRVHAMGAGVAVISCSGEEEKEAIEADLGDGLKYTQKIYTTGDPNLVMKLYVPDLSSGQFREIWNIAQEEIATDMDMSKKLISGDPQGDVSSAKWDTEISYTPVYQCQRHYKKNTEHALYLLGITDTTFKWNDPFPTENMQENKEGNNNGNTPRTNPASGLEDGPDESGSEDSPADNSDSSDKAN